MPDPKAEQRQTTLNEATASLKRMQEFAVDTLPRVNDLGAVINFNEAIEPATKLISLYKQLSLDVLESLSIANLNAIKSSADSNFNQLDSILKFEPGTAASARDSLLRNPLLCCDFLDGF